MTPPSTDPETRPSALSRLAQRRWTLPWRALLLAVACGLGALLMMASQLSIFVPGTSVTSDPREIVDTLGAAVCGPLGAILIGLLAGCCEPTPGLAPVSMAQHALACLWLALGYRRFVAPQRKLSLILALWAGLVAVYYVICLVALVFLTRLNGPLYTRVYGHAGPWRALCALAAGTRIEFLLTVVITTLMLYAMPKRWRRPLA